MCRKDSGYAESCMQMKRMPRFIRSIFAWTTCSGWRCWPIFSRSFLSIIKGSSPCVREAAANAAIVPHCSMIVCMVLRPIPGICERAYSQSRSFSPLIFSIVFHPCSFFFYYKKRQRGVTKKEEDILFLRISSPNCMATQSMPMP